MPWRAGGLASREPSLPPRWTLPKQELRAWPSRSPPARCSAPPRLRGNAGIALAALAVVLGAFLYGFSLTEADADHPAWPGWVIGAPVAALAYFTLRDVASVAAPARGRGRSRRSRLPHRGIRGLALAGISLLGPAAYIGVVALLAIIYLAFARRKRAGEKHAGLRSLR